MNPSIFANPLLFSAAFYAFTMTLVTLVDFPDQKYVLFKKLPDGRIRKVETFTEPISREEAVKAVFGPRF